MASSVRVTGVREFVEACQRLGVSMDDLRAAFSAVAAAGASTAAAYAPKRTGTLASNVRGSHAAKKAVVRAGGALVPYAGPINYGWIARGIKGDGFMQRTDAVWRPVALERLKQELDRKIRQEGLE